MAEPDARLHRDHGDAGVDDVELGDMRRAGESRVDLGGVAEMEIQCDIVGDVIVELRRAGFGRFRRIGHRRQRLDVDLDGLGGVAGLRQRIGHDKGDGIADIAHLVRHQRHAVGLQQRRAVAALQRQSADERLVAGRYEIGAGPHAEHARHPLGRGNVDALDDAVGVAGTHHPGIGLLRQAEIVGVLALAADQRVIFLAADGLADAIFLQCNSVFDRSGRRVILHAENA